MPKGVPLPMVPVLSQSHTFDQTFAAGAQTAAASAPASPSSPHSAPTVPPSEVQLNPGPFAYPARVHPSHRFAASSSAQDYSAGARLQHHQSVAGFEPQYYPPFGSHTGPRQTLPGKSWDDTPAPNPDAVGLRVAPTESNRSAKLLFCGGVAGAVSRTATAPIDRLKFLLQVQDGQRMMSLREGLRQMASEGTLRAYFRGNGANVIKNIPETALKLTCNDRIKAVVLSDGHQITLGERLLIGGLSGGIAQGAIYPLEVIQTRLAVCRPGMYKGILDAAGKIMQQEGGRAFFRGITPCMVGILPYAGMDIAAFEILKEYLHDTYSGCPPSHLLLLAGMVSSTSAQLVAYPLSLVRTRLQAQGIGGEPLKYRGMFDVIYKTVAHEGVRGLYKGLVPNLLKIAPAAGISWMVFEQGKKHMQLEDVR